MKAEAIVMHKEKQGVKKPVRSISGVCIVAVVTNDKNCAWSKCIYCPKFDAPKSYTGLEPAIQRAAMNDYDSFKQVINRLSHYKVMGHLSEKNKIEVIILGGTFLGMPKDYKENFVKGIFDALNGVKAKDLEEAKKMNEKASNRCVQFIVETRPDFCFEKHVDEMLSYGVTGVEIGVQTIYPEILRLINRGHTIEDVIKASEIARNAGLKVGFHIMPCLPGSNFEMDLNMFKEIFENPNFRPDYLKIYPTLVVKNTKLYEMWKRGEYKAWELEEVVDLIARIKKFIPPYCRIQRIGRALSANEIVAGYKKTNLREIVRKRARELGINCKCIRCREVGFKIMQNIFPEKAEVCRMDYEANGGREIFLSFEDKKNDILFAFLRLRIPNKSHREEITGDAAVIRELKVVGHHVGIGNEPDGFQFQHRGFGRALLKKAEEIAKEEFGKNKILILSGVGAREYYRKFGYRLEGPYMVKNL